MDKYCFLCGAPMNGKLCTNPDCVRSKPIKEKKDTAPSKKEEKK